MITDPLPEETMQSINIHLHYVYDPLCRWCFGFHPIIEKIEKRFEGRMTVDALPGGLAIDENAESIREGYPDLMDEVKKVEEVTRRKFGEPFRLLVEEGSYKLNSLPASIAQTIVNEKVPEHSVAFAGRLQDALFMRGGDIREIRVLTEIISDYGISREEFERLMESEEVETKTRDNFEWCREKGAGVFPSLLIKIGDEYGVMSKGYRPYDTIESHLHHIILNAERLFS